MPWYHPISHEIGYQSSNLDRQVMTVLPHPDLMPYIASYIIVKVGSSKPEASNWMILPDGSAHLIFKVFDDDASSLTLVGSRTSSIEINRNNRPFTVIVRFHAWGLSLLKDFIPETLVDTSLSLHSNLEHSIFHQLEACYQNNLDVSLQPFIHCLNQIFIKNITVSPDKILQEFIRKVKEVKGIVSVESLAKEIGVSSRYLRKHIKKHTGLNPKLLAKIERLSSALKSLNSLPRDNWASLAIAHGYYDQSHMIDDFQSLLNISPDKLLQKLQ